MENEEEKNKVNEDAFLYKREIRFFNSFEEQAEYELFEMAKLTPIERLMQMRKFINIAYAMHGYNPSKLPSKHKIKIIT